MSQVLPPVCFVLALLCLIGVFALLAFGTPQIPMSLQEAELNRNDELRDREEEKFRASVRQHYLTIAALAIAGILLAGAGFMSIRPSS